MTSGGGGPGSRGAELLPVPPAVGTQRALPCRSFCVVDSLRPRRGGECFLEGAICSSRDGRRRGGGSARPGAGLPGGGKHSRRALSRQLAGWPRLEPQAARSTPLPCRAPGVRAGQFLREGQTPRAPSWRPGSGVRPRCP